MWNSLETNMGFGLLFFLFFSIIQGGPKKRANGSTLCVNSPQPKYGVFWGREKSFESPMKARAGRERMRQTIDTCSFSLKPCLQAREPPGFYGWGLRGSAQVHPSSRGEARAGPTGRGPDFGMCVWQRGAEINGQFSSLSLFGATPWKYGPVRRSGGAGLGEREAEWIYCHGGLATDTHTMGLRYEEGRLVKLFACHTPPQQMTMGLSRWRSLATSPTQSSLETWLPFFIDFGMACVWVAF